MGDRAVVIGGGIIGLAAAYELRSRGLDVTVCDAGTCGRGASWGNAGWITPAFSAPVPAPGVLRGAVASAVMRRGPVRLRLSAAPHLGGWLLAFARACDAGSHRAGTAATAALAADAVERYRAWADDGLIELRGGEILFVYSDPGHAAADAEAFQRVADATAGGVKVLDAGEVMAAEPALRGAPGGGFSIGGQAFVDPIALVDALALRLRLMGVTITEQATVTGFERAPGGSVTAVAAGGERMPANYVVVAAGARSGEVLRLLGVRVRMAAGKGYSLRVATGTVPRTPVYLADEKLAITPFGTSMRVAGMMELAGLDDRLRPEMLGALRRSASRYIGPWSRADESEPWCGWRPMTPDGLPVIDTLPGAGNVAVGTGHAMLGVTLAPATAERLASLLLDRAAAPLPEFAIARLVTR